MDYNLIDWYLDTVDRGRCLSCRGFTIERVGTLTAQCYSCGRWYDGHAIGRAHSDLVHLSTTYQQEEKKRGHVQTYGDMCFEERLSQTPNDMEDFGDYPE